MNSSMIDMRHALARMGIFAMPAATRLCAHGYKLHRMELGNALALAEKFDGKVFVTVKTRKLRLMNSPSGSSEVWTIRDLELLLRSENAVCLPGLYSRLPARTRIQDIGNGLLSVDGFWKDVGEDRILLTRCPVAANVTSRAWLAE
ncbi:hypothetical protein K5D56_21660 [Pseudomonas cichorii]|nr:hypothetical protein [Pseudomonas cichorii]MBX8557075.1 hypothetical protein [Pseudomonas cichorii]MBX8591976.1 hypothetical protein [Pseudomonas cichorii]